MELLSSGVGEVTANDVEMAAAFGGMYIAMCSVMSIELTAGQ